MDVPCDMHEGDDGDGVRGAAVLAGASGGVTGESASWKATLEKATKAVVVLKVCVTRASVCPCVPCRPNSTQLVTTFALPSAQATDAFRPVPSPCNPQTTGTRCFDTDTAGSSYATGELSRVLFASFSPLAELL
jgi:hypothetical protein